jgi:hypothetical protein
MAQHLTIETCYHLPCEVSIIRFSPALDSRGLFSVEFLTGKEKVIRWKKPTTGDRA